MKFCILTAAYGRYPVFEVFLDWFNLVKLSRYKNVFNLVVAADDYKIKEMCEQYEAYYVKADNDILGNKWNTGLKKCKEIDFDYLIIMGSDDITSVTIFDVYTNLYPEKAIGWKDIYFYDAESKRMKYWPGYNNDREGESIGAGRAIHRDVLDKLNWQLWDIGRKKHLDANMSTRFKPFDIRPKILSLKEYGEFMVDIKTTKNMSQFSEYKGDFVDLDLFKKHLLVSQIEKIKNLEG